MTMTRAAKRQATKELHRAATTGITGIRFASPRLSFAAKATRGHDYMTGPEYAAHRLGRGQMATCRLDLKIEQRTRSLRQASRKVARVW
jgi:hypothetical protein